MNRTSEERRQQRVAYQREYRRNKRAQQIESDRERGREKKREIILDIGNKYQLINFNKKHKLMLNVRE